jgi:hypothetical protein
MNRTVLLQCSRILPRIPKDWVDQYRKHALTVPSPTFCNRREKPVAYMYQAGYRVFHIPDYCGEFCFIHETTLRECQKKQLLTMQHAIIDGHVMLI